MENLRYTLVPYLFVIFLLLPLFSQSPLLGPKEPPKDAAADTKKVIPDKMAAEYWRARAVLMDSRMDLANCQSLGCKGSDWNRIGSELSQREKEFNSTLASLYKVCAIDTDFLEREKILRCIGSSK